MTRIILTGGLGNQLFKALGAIKVLKNELGGAFFDISWYQSRNFSQGITAVRDFELHNFPNLRVIPTLVKSYSFSSFESRLMADFPKVMRFFGYLSASDSQLFSNVPPRVVKEDFEDLSSLPTVSLISKLLEFGDLGSSWLNDMKELSAVERPIAVHVRRSDYLNYSNTYPTLGLSYYLPALERLTEVLGERPVWLFSDEPDLVLSEFQNMLKFDRVIEPKAADNSVELLELMSTSLGIITANSTFSWWAAYLGELNGNVKVVAMPEIFTLLEDDPGRRLRVPGWKIIPVTVEENR